MDKKKIGFVRSILPEFILVRKGFVRSHRYLIPKYLIQSVDKKGVGLSVTAYETGKYSSWRMKPLSSFGKVPTSALKERPIRDRLETLRYGTTRNRLAAAIAVISGMLFLASGYRANIEIYNLIREQLVINTVRDFWIYAVIPVGLLALLAQLGGFTVMMGAGLFAANRVNIGKFLVFVGTGQGVLTILIRIIMEFWTGKLALDNNYITWLTSSAAGLGILFAMVASYLTKGKGESIYKKTGRFVLRKIKKS